MRVVPCHANTQMSPSRSLSISIAQWASAHDVRFPIFGREWRISRRFPSSLDLRRVPRNGRGQRWEPWLAVELLSVATLRRRSAHFKPAHNVLCSVTSVGSFRGRGVFVEFAAPVSITAAAIAVVTLPRARMMLSDFGPHRRKSTGPGPSQSVFQLHTHDLCQKIVLFPSFIQELSFPTQVLPFKSPATICQTISDDVSHVATYPADMQLQLLFCKAPG